MKVKTHPLAEIIARKLSGIDTVPPTEQRRMVSRAITAAVKYHEDKLNEAGKNIFQEENKP